MIIDYTKFLFVWYVIRNTDNGVVVTYYGRPSEEMRIKFGITSKMQKLFFLTLKPDFIDEDGYLEQFRQNPGEFIKTISKFKDEHGEKI